MKPEYDFSNAQKGKFYYPEAEYRFPVFLDPDVDEMLSKLAEDKGVEVQELVNEWLRVSIQMIQTVQ